MSFRRTLFERFRNQGSLHDLPLRIVLWDGESFDFAPHPTVTLTVRSRAVMRSLIAGRIDKLGDAYVTGELTVDGQTRDILQVGMLLAERLGRLSRWAAPIRLLGRRRFRHSRKDDAAAISYHYDVSNDFYRLWLDEQMVYSCGYFQTGLETIDQAQEQKIDHICRKLRLTAGERLLDIGCGWGALVRRAACKHGVMAVGITNSMAQCRYAQDLIVTNGLQRAVEIRHGDYRDLSASAVFDKIVSVGMYEHVGLANLPDYFRRVARLLKPGGVFLNHGIVTTDPEGQSRGPPGGEFIDRYVFPGGELPNLPHALREIMRSGLEPADVEDLRPHYARTLLLWSRRLEARSRQAIEIAGAERYRIWRMYLAAMGHAFDQGWLSVAQIVAYKPSAGRPARRPWSRRHQYYDERGAPPPLAGALDWGAD
jgi:cyclopropane-fatty-acyl-phospholipid synthase